MNRIRILLLTLGLLGMLSGCGRSSSRVRVGAKDFAEQEILAHMAVLLLKGEEIPVAPVVSTTETFTSHSKLRNGEIDVAIQYTGTAMNLLGIDPQAKGAMEKLEQQYQELDIEWLPPLGFDNGYRIYVFERDARSRKLNEIADLKKLGTVRIACPWNYRHRMRDGLKSLEKAHGLTLGSSPYLEDDIQERVKALTERRVDAMVGFATDGVARRESLVTLEDSKNFYPQYEAAFLVRNDTPNGQAVRKALTQLSGLIDNSTMQDLNYKVEEKGQTPAKVARDFLSKLHKEKKIETSIPIKQRPVELVLAYDSTEDMQSILESAKEILQGAFPVHRIETLETTDPAYEVSRGKARLALVAAEQFFRESKSGRLKREERLEAAVVVAARDIHIIQTKQNATRELTEDFTYGVAATAGKGVLKIVDDIFHVPSKEVFVAKNTSELLDAIEEQKCDVGVLLDVLPKGPAAQTPLKTTLANHPDLALCSLGPLVTKQAVTLYLRPSTINANLYPENTTKDVNTYSSQVVLAGASHKLLGGSAAGPASALPIHGVPLTRKELEALDNESGYGEAPDSALPSAWVGVGFGPVQRESFLIQAIQSVLNVLVIVFLAWLVFLVLRPGEAPMTQPTNESPSNDSTMEPAEG